MNIINQPKLTQAIQQVRAEKCFLNSDEEKSILWQAAIDKAVGNIYENDSVEFDGTRLTLRSLKSGAFHIITKGGCDTDCPNKTEVDYHRALFAILSAYTLPSPLAMHPDVIHEDEAAIYIGGGYSKEEPKVGGFRL